MSSMYARPKRSEPAASTQSSGSVPATQALENRQDLLPDQTEGETTSVLDAAASELSGPTTPEYGRVVGKPPLRKGDMGWRVTALQEALIAHGADIIADSQYGNRTKRAVAAFQAEHGLTVDGIAGPQTAGKLNALRAPEVQNPGNEEDEAQEAEMEPFTGRPVLKRGASGPQVRSLQAALSRAGFDVTVTGGFDWPTWAAVKAYQRSRALEVDGLVGPNTAQALNSNAPERERAPNPGGDEKKKNFDPGGRLNKSEMNPATVALTEKTCLALQEQGYFPYVVSGFRSFSEQNGIYEQGRSKPGPKVTWVRGGGSWHNYGLAVDIAFWNDSGSAPTWEEHHPWSKLGEEGLKAGFTRWGGDFGDRPHLEYHPNWGNGASSLASTYHSEGLSAVWKKVGAS